MSGYRTNGDGLPDRGGNPWLFGPGIGWGVPGLLAGAPVAFGLGLLWLTFGIGKDREGAAAMAAAFAFVPLGGVIGAAAGAACGAAQRG